MGLAKSVDAFMVCVGSANFLNLFETLRSPQDGCKCISPPAFLFSQTHFGEKIVISKNWKYFVRHSTLWQISVTAENVEEQRRWIGDDFLLTTHRSSCSWLLPCVTTVQTLPYDCSDWWVRGKIWLVSTLQSIQTFRFNSQYHLKWSEIFFAACPCALSAP